MDLKTSAWTNESIIGLKEDDPVEFVRDKARKIVLDALDDGWMGPPFNVVKLAEHAGIRIQPSDDVREASLEFDGKQSVIKFNPNRPSGRVRFSIAHEIAHTFFPDHQIKTRYRNQPSSQDRSDWQLEALCNIGAAELLMPLMALPQIDSSKITIGGVLQLAKQFQTSTEATLIRLTEFVSGPIAMFSASAKDDVNRGSAFNIDYVLGSESITRTLNSETFLPKNSVLRECKSPGHIAQRVEQWGDQMLKVEAVGLPPYQHSRTPRVAGLLFPAAENEIRSPIKYLMGDATSPSITGPIVLIHIVNDSTPRWGGQFARSLKDKWVNAQASFIQWAESDNSNLTLGSVHFVDVSDRITIGTLVSQRGYGASARPRLRYSALKECLQQVADFAQSRAASVHMPRIGAGQAGGSWDIIEQLIASTLAEKDIEVVVYDLPNQPKPLSSNQPSLFKLF